MRDPWRLRRDHQYESGSDESAVEIDLCCVRYCSWSGRDGRPDESAAAERAVVRTIPEREE